MADALHALVPLFAFMLIPLWIPLIAATSGAIVDLVSRSGSGVQHRRTEPASGNQRQLQLEALVV
jgi:hypothetical protein